MSVPPLVEAQDLTKHFPVRRGILQRPRAWMRAVDGVTLSIRQGETLGLVGESGCGKTTLARCLLRIIEPSAGQVYFQGEDLLAMPARRLKDKRRDMQMVFQDPYGSLNPRRTVEECISEGLQIHALGSHAERRDRVQQALIRVGLQPQHAASYPRELSGGQRQRVGLARALVLEPQFLIADEPVSALDVSIQSQILNLLLDLQNDLDLTYLIIAHNLGVVEHISHRVAVMYLGRIIELAPCETLFSRPMHPYTQALMASIPGRLSRADAKTSRLRGEIPSPMHPPSGCRFHPRCPLSDAHCAQEAPLWMEIEPGHFVACWRVN